MVRAPDSHMKEFESVRETFFHDTELVITFTQMKRAQNKERQSAQAERAAEARGASAHAVRRMELTRKESHIS